MKFLIKVFFVSFFVSIMYAQENTWKITGQIQARSELDARDFHNSTNPISTANIRTRIGVENTLFNKLNFMVQFQDSRLFGQEKSTTASIAI